MSEFNRSPIVINGKGNNFGDNNTSTNIESLKIENITNVTGGGGKGPDSDPRAAALGALAAVVIVAWFYLRHFFQIHDALYVGCFLSMAPALFSVTAASFRGDDLWFSSLKIVPMCLVAIAALVVLARIREAMPQDVLEMAAISSASETWHRLTDHGQRIVLESVGGATICALAIILNLLASIRTFVAASGKWANWLLSLTDAFEMAPIAMANTILLTLSWGVSSGVAYDYWKALQLAMAPAGA